MDYEMGPKAFPTSSRMLGQDAGMVAAEQDGIESNQSPETLPQAVNEYLSASTEADVSDKKTPWLSSSSFIHLLAGTARKTQTNFRFRYRERVRQFAEEWPQADLLVSYLDQDWSQRDARLRAAFTNLIVSDVLKNGDTSTVELGCSDLKDHRKIQDVLLQPPSNANLRLIMVPDVSPTVVGLLGDTFNINPLVFVAALQDIWSKSDVELETASRLSLDKNFGASFFSYDSETELNSSLTFFSNQFPFEDIRAQLNTRSVTELVDSTIIEQDCKDKFGSRAIHAFHPILCPRVRKSSAGTVKLSRVYQAMNRLTVFEIKGSECPLFLILTTSSNDWCERDRYLYEAARAHEHLPSWITRLTARLGKLLNAPIVDVHTHDNGNPFFSRILGDGASAAQGWLNASSQTQTWEKLSSYYTRELLPLVLNYSHSPMETMLAMDVWATKRAADAFEEALNRARGRLNWFQANTELYKSTSISGRIDILRSHRDILSSSKERIEAHIQKFQVSSLKTMQRSEELEANWGTETKTLLLRLRESRLAMEAVFQTNERLIQDCLFDLQLELTNTQLLESRRSIEQNATVKRLTTLAFIFIPISTVAGVFSMNVKGLHDIEVWVFVTVTVSVLAAAFLVAGYRVVKALLSAIEALAFRHSRVGQLNGIWEAEAISTTSRKSSKWSFHMLQRLGTTVYILAARLGVFIFALCSLIFLPIEIIWYWLKYAVEFGIAQDQLHAHRRLKVEDAWVRANVKSSTDAWFDELSTAPRWKQGLWKLAFIPALIYAYLEHHFQVI